MRRKDKLVSDPERMKEIIQAAPYMVLGLVDGGESYQVPLDFGYDGETLYFHCAREGRKLEALKKHPQVSVLFVDYGGVYTSGKDDTACSYSTRFASVMGWGRAEILDDPEAKAYAFKVLMAKIGRDDLPLRPGMLEATCVVKIRLDELVGKQSPAKQ